MYFVSRNKRMASEVAEALKKHFGDNATVNLQETSIQVYVKDGHPDLRRYLSEEEIERGVLGGGHVQGLDGHIFSIRVESEEK